jgi:hypothetical protein
MHRVTVQFICLAQAVILWKFEEEFNIKFQFSVFYLAWRDLNFSGYRSNLIPRKTWFRLLVNDQLDAQLFSTYLFQFSTCFEQPRAHHQENQLYQYYISIRYSVLVTVSCAGLRPAHEWHIPDVVLIQLILLMISTRLLKTCRELK